MTSSSIRRLLSRTLFLTLVSSQAIAQTYKWVDESGAVHYGDALPSRYRSAQQLKGMPASPTSAETQAARERTERDAQRAKELGDRRQNADRVQKNLNRRADLAPAPEGETPCQREWRDYENSRACFDSYRLKNHAMRPEAFEHCDVVEKPLHDCK